MSVTKRATRSSRRGGSLVFNNGPRELRHAVEMLQETGHVGGRLAVGPEVGQKQRLGLPVSNQRGAGLPDLNINIWRWRGWHREQVGASTNAGRIAHERHAAFPVEITHVMGRMTGGIGHLQIAVGHTHALPPGERLDVLLGHRQELAPQSIHLVTVEPGRAVDELGRVYHVTRTSFVHVDLDLGVVAHEGSGGASVIEMNVG